MKCRLRPRARDRVFRQFFNALDFEPDVLTPPGPNPPGRAFIEPDEPPGNCATEMVERGGFWLCPVCDLMEKW